MNHPENELNKVLYQLRSEHQSIEVPAFLEDQLAQRARWKADSMAPYYWSLTRGWAWGLSLSFALVAIALTVAWRLSSPGSLHPQQQIVARPAAAVRKPTVEQTTIAAQLRTQNRQISLKPRRHAVQRPQTESSLVATTGFLSLPAGEGLPEPAQQSIVRTRILTSSLPQYGLEVPASMQPQFVSAEFLVGEDGLPRAIRFVR